MKTIRFIITIVAITCFSGNLFAQEALKQIVKKCENMEGVNLTVVTQKSETNKKHAKTITSISFNNNEALGKEIITAFEKDREGADKAIENKSGGKIDDLFYSFGSTSYAFSVSKNGQMCLSVIEK